MAHSDFLPQLPTDIARHTIFLLLEELPPPLSDTVEERAARDASAIASLAALKPGDAFEALLAKRAVATDARAAEALRLASVPRMHPDRVDQCVRQANAMMRASDSALRSLRAMQAVRAKAEQAVQQTAPAAAEPPARDLAAEAKQYALRKPKDAARIRQLGRLPQGHPPLRSGLVHAIATGTGPALRALDRSNQEDVPKAA
jgi:hypothetical protein